MGLNNGASNKIDATIMDIDWERFFARAVDAQGTDIFIFHNAIERMGQWAFKDLRTGTRVRLTLIDHPKGPRGIEVQILEL